MRERERDQEVKLVAALTDRQLSADGFHEALTDGRPHVDEALLDHLHRIEHAVQLLGRHHRGARADQDADAFAALALGVLASRSWQGLRPAYPSSALPD